MRVSGRRCASSCGRAAERALRGPVARPTGRALASAALVAAALGLAPAPAEAYRRGLASSVGGATIGSGHVFWLGLGYPGLGAGWGLSLHPVVDLMVEAGVVFGHPAAVDRLVLGGGGRVAARFGLVRGRTSLGLSVRLGATAYGEASGLAAIVEIVSPGLDVSFRTSDRLSLHAGLRVALEYVTVPAAPVGGFEARVGLSYRLVGGLGLFVRASGGGTLWTAQGGATPRFEGLAGLEYVLDRRP